MGESRVMNNKERPIEIRLDGGLNHLEKKTLVGILYEVCMLLNNSFGENVLGVILVDLNIEWDTTICELGSQICVVL